MKQRQVWLFALLSILTFVVAPSIATAASSTGNFEVGATYTDVVDNKARVNEYTTNGALDNLDDGFAASIKLDLKAADEKSAFDFSSEIINGDNYKLEGHLDAARVLRWNFSLDAMQHWKDHETLDQMGATGREDVGGGQPSVTTDKIFADLLDAGYTGPVGGGSVASAYDPREAYEQELANDYIVTRREFENEFELALPQLPNIVFHAGMRIETRDGLEQAIGLSKCDSCHVSATGKEIDERTEEFRIGATGKFGQLTVEYEFMNRSFDENSSAPIRFYESAGNASAEAQLLYGADGDPLRGDGYLEFNRTPDSDKDSHFLKARYDITSSTSVSASYTKADIESDKSDVASDYSYDLANDTLETEFESFGGKLATRLGAWRLSARANTYSIDATSNTIELRDELTTRDDADLLSFELDKEWHPAEARDVNEFGVDAAYRIATGTTLRLGLDYEEIERADHHLGDTETTTAKVALKSRLNKTLSGRVSYKYESIDNPLDNHTGIAQGIGTQDSIDPNLWYLQTADHTAIDNNNGTNVWYWNSVYPNRTLTATNLPEDVHEAKINTTWSPSTNMAATFFARVRYEENDSVDYEQSTYAPGVSFWYAPNSKINLTMAYTFNKQQTENRMCVGWYHG